MPRLTSILLLVMSVSLLGACAEGTFKSIGEKALPDFEDKPVGLGRLHSEDLKLPNIEDRYVHASFTGKSEGYLAPRSGDKPRLFYFSRGATITGAVKNGVEMDLILWNARDNFELATTPGIRDKDANGFYIGRVEAGTSTVTLLKYFGPERLALFDKFGNQALERTYPAYLMSADVDAVSGELYFSYTLGNEVYLASIEQSVWIDPQYNGTTLIPDGQMRLQSMPVHKGGGNTAAPSAEDDEYDILGSVLYEDNDQTCQGMGEIKAQQIGGNSYIALAFNRGNQLIDTAVTPFDELGQPFGRISLFDGSGILIQDSDGNDMETLSSIGLNRICQNKMDFSLTNNTLGYLSYSDMGLMSFYQADLTNSADPIIQSIKIFRQPKISYISGAYISAFYALNNGISIGNDSSNNAYMALVTLTDLEILEKYGRKNPALGLYVINDGKLINQDPLFIFKQDVTSDIGFPVGRNYGSVNLMLVRVGQYLMIIDVDGNLIEGPTAYGFDASAAQGDRMFTFFQVGDVGWVEQLAELSNQVRIYRYAIQ